MTPWFMECLAATMYSYHLKQNLPMLFSSK